MNIVSTTPATSGKARLRGVALASVIIALMLSLLLEALDQTIVGTAMPRIIAQLHSLDRYTWVVTAYVLATMTMVPMVGKLPDQLGRKRFLLGSTALFLVGSLLAGASQTMNQLILFRALQGLGAGMGMALVATVFGDLFEPAARAKWGSVFGIVFCSSPGLCADRTGRGFLPQGCPFRVLFLSSSLCAGVPVGTAQKLSQKMHKSRNKSTAPFEIHRLLKDQKPVLVVLDGRSGAGKSPQRGG